MIVGYSMQWFRVCAFQVIAGVNHLLRREKATSLSCGLRVALGHICSIRFGWLSSTPNFPKITPNSTRKIPSKLRKGLLQMPYYLITGIIQLIPGYSGVAFGDSNKSLPEPGFVRRLDEQGERMRDYQGRTSREGDVADRFHFNEPYKTSGAIKPSILTHILSHHPFIHTSIMPVQPINSLDEFKSLVRPAICLRSVSDAHALINASTL